MSDAFKLVPNKWVTEDKLTEITGMKHGTIERARRKSWFAGREYVHVAPEGDPNPNTACMYNTDAINQWIESQIAKQPSAR
ncbi:MAG TPA: excisionase family protein [Scandinavium sp.]|jgi:hypothetical protein